MRRVWSLESRVLRFWDVVDVRDCLRLNCLLWLTLENTCRYQ